MSGDGQRRKLLTPQEVADHLGVPLDTIYVWSIRGKGPPVMKVGRHLRFDPDALDRWLEGQTKEQHPRTADRPPVHIEGNRL